MVDKTDEANAERQRHRNKSQLADHEMMIFNLLLAGALAGGHVGKQAEGQANQALDAIKRKFT